MGVLAIHINPENYEKMKHIDYFEKVIHAMGVFDIVVGTVDYTLNSSSFLYAMYRKGLQQTLDYFKKKMVWESSVEDSDMLREMHENWLKANSDGAKIEEPRQVMATANGDEGPSSGEGDGHDDEWPTLMRSPGI
ncbi:hypothetical protein Pyn_35615 [Prunus yedoensis var. nudiflora]|uniref:Uncharacterized protein n=1 Tax=Prunus yedoensis var. nudiflora TaxID=2094558 RepID=A0A314UIY2_PRUYE|nr:hypothetical protein Pyn_35615 [Prunus yedoensis var. nudiflora]